MKIFIIYLTIVSNYVIIQLRKRANTRLFLPTEPASVFPCFCIFPVMPLNIPSVDLTRSQAYDNGALLVQRPHRTNNPDLPHRREHLPCNKSSRIRQAYQGETRGI